MAFFPSLPADAQLLDVFSRYKDLARPLIELHELLMRGPSPLSTGERELIAAYVSGLNACRYCHDSHRVIAEQLGVRPGLLAALLDDIDQSDADAALKPLLKYARKLTLTPAKMVQADADSMFTAGWDERALHHVIMTTALFNFMNRMVDGHGLEESQFAARGGDREASEDTYRGLLRSLELECRNVT